MGSEVRDALRGLCCGRGWSYGVLWRFDRRDPRLLTMEDSYYEEHMETVVHKMRNQIHVVGEGSIGAVALSGMHQWNCSDAYCMEGDLIGTGSNLEMLQGNAEGSHQFLSGMKTIVIIALPSLGVAQFGSSNKISENMEFVNQVKCSFQQMETMKKTLLLRDAHVSLNSRRQQETFASVISSGQSYPRKVDNINLVREYSCKEQASSSTGLIQSFNPFLVGSHCDSRSHNNSQNLHVFAMPIISSSAYAIDELGDSIQKTTSITKNSCCLTNQCQEAMPQTLVSMSSNSQLPQGKQSHSISTIDSAAMYLNTITWNKETNIQMMEQRLSYGMHMQEVLSGLSVPLFNTNLWSDFASFNSPECMVPGSRSIEIGQAILQGAGMLLDYKHSSSSSSFHDVESNASACKSSSQVPSFAAELADGSLSIPPDAAAEKSRLRRSKEDAMDGNLIDQAAEKDKLLVSASPCLLGDDTADCILTTELTNRAVEKSVVDPTNSLDGDNGKENSCNVLTQSLSDNDLFDGMELDLNPNTLGQESWDDILMPVGSGTCSSLSTSVLECISELDMGSMGGAHKGLFPDPGLEQLLDAVVNGNANLASCRNSVDTNINSVASSDSEYQFSTTTNIGGTPVYRNEAPLMMGLACLSQKMDMLFPDYNLGKMMQKSSSEAQLKSQVSPWISDSYSMNAESAVINQCKRPEEPAKVVRKRARPGESTRPRPKDRQQIQDRVKELREIVPNSAKCSIDALLDRTIKHMLYLQSVTKYADKLKQADEPKMIGDESGVVLKDNSSGDGGGATWAFEVAGQTMVCPIIVEDVNPPGQMLVEMLCEDRGFFLEIADIIRGFGLTILKGVMEIHDSKIWARFSVEANRDVTRMDIFLSLVQLLQQTAHSVHSSDQSNKIISDGVPTLPGYQQAPMPVPITLADNLQ